jgi:CRP-like cAMP-binding protein/ATP/ADP translocase/HEAT repeat protein
MARFLEKLFNIRRQEWSRVSLLFLIATLTNLISIWGSTIAYADFLKTAGLSAVPWILIASSVLSIIAAAVYTAFVDRIANDKLLIGLYILAAFGILIGLALLLLGYPLVAFLLLYLFSLAWNVVYNSHFPTYINNLYDIQSAKRVLPLVFAGFRVGSIVGGLTLALLTANLSFELIVVIWLGANVMLAGLVWGVPYLLKEKGLRRERIRHTAPEKMTHAAKPRTSYIENVRDGLRYTLQNTYLRWIAIDTLLFMMLMSVIEYASSGTLLKIYQTSTEFANYIALIGGIANLVALPILLFGMSRLISRLGVGNAKLIFPAGTLLTSASLIFAPGLISASAGYIDRTAFRLTFQSSVDNLLYNAVPLRVKGRSRAFVSGLLVPIGALLGGALLFLPFVATTWFVPAVIGILAIGYMLTAWFTRRQYSQALVKMLEQEDYSFLLSQEASELNNVDPATLLQLQKKLQESSSPELKAFIAQLIAQVGGNNAAPILVQVVQEAEDARTRAALLDVVVASDLHAKIIANLYIRYLNDPDPAVRQAVIAGLEELVSSTHPHLLLRLMPMLQDPALEVRVRVLSAICRCGYFYQTPPAIQLLDQLLGATDPHQRTAGVRILEQIGLKAASIEDQALQRLTNYLSDPADEVRLEAAVASETLLRALNKDRQLVDTTGDVLYQHVREKIEHLLHDPIERVRQSALILLAEIGARDTDQSLANALADRSPQVRATAIDLIVRNGKAAIPLIHPRLNSPDPQMRKMAAVVLSRVDPKEFGPLISETGITANLLDIYGNLGLVEALSPLKQYRGIGVLDSALREQNRQQAEEIFYLLRVIHEANAIGIIYDSLRSPDPRMRANAHEALESMTTPQTARLIAPLFEPDMNINQLLAFSHETWEMKHPNTPQALQRLASQPDNPWLRAITLFALGEISASFAPVNEVQPVQTTDAPAAAPSVESSTVEAPAPPNANQDSVVQPAESSRRRRSVADRLSLLMGDGNSSTEKTESPKPAEGPAQPDRATATLASVGLTLAEMIALIDAGLNDPSDEVRTASTAAKRVMAARSLQAENQIAAPQEATLLSTIEKIIFLKQVPFFQGMTIEQLRILASVCEEEFFVANTRLYQEKDPGGVLYMVINGRVGIEQEKRKGSFARLSQVNAYSYFGEANLFDNSPRTTSAVAVQDTLTLQLRREPLIALARQYPELSLELINVLSLRLREVNDHVADLTRAKPRELMKLYDKFDETS